MSPIRPDWTPPPRDGLSPGTHLLEVSEVEQKRSKAKNDLMLRVKFKAVEGPCKGQTIEDYFMLEGRARGLGQQKLRALGIEEGAEFEEHHLIGRRVYAAIVEEEHEYKGRKQMQARIDIGAEDSMAGLWPEDAPPEGVDTNEPLANAIDEKPLSDDDTPF